ncbi:hypothetical protein QBC39DRAFT_26427 [Podospora conica]|nr:hypothetical protein QBC39DRAFT_26427 [Schizothecium conicum]
MAAIGPIEVFGIAFGRAVAIHHGTAVDDIGSPSSEISFSSIDVDEDKVTRTLRGPPTGSTSPPSFSSAPIVHEDMFLGDIGSVLTQDAVRQIPRARAPPIVRFLDTLQRHESTALAVARHTPRDVPYLNYVPSPGSDLGSPALSVATNYILPGAAPPSVEPPLPRLPVGTLALCSLAGPRALLNAGPTPMSRFLADAGPYEWMAPTFDNTTVLPTIEMDDDHSAGLSSTEPSLTLDGTRFHAQQNGTPLAIEAGLEITPDDSHNTVLEELESAASRKHGRGGLKFDDAVGRLVKHLGDQRQERVIKENLPRALRAPRKRESPPHKKRKTGDPGYQHQHPDS